MRFSMTQEAAPDKPKFPTSDLAYDMAAALLESKKRKKKKLSKESKLAGVNLELDC